MVNSWVPWLSNAQEMSFLWHTSSSSSFSSILLQCSLRFEVSGIAAGHFLMSWNRHIIAMSTHKAFSGSDGMKWHSWSHAISHLYHTKSEVEGHAFYLWQSRGRSTAVREISWEQEGHLRMHENSETTEGICGHIKILLHYETQDN